jgi:hypothetical protein
MTNNNGGSHHVSDRSTYPGYALAFACRLRGAANGAGSDGAARIAKEF